MIKVYGYLGKRFTKQLNARVSSIGEAIRALDANYPGFRQAIDKSRNYIVVRGDTLKDGQSLTEDEALMNFSDKETWHILPVPHGAGDNAGIFAIIAGVVLLVAAFWTGGATAAPGAKLLGVGAGLGGFVGTMGVALVLGGVAQLMTPTPGEFDYDSRDTSEQKKSYIFQGPVNSVEPGVALPIAYGETFIGSIFISGGLEISDISV